MNQRLSIVLASLFGSFLIGCEKVPTFQEITGQDANKNPPAVSNVPPPVVTAEKVAAETAPIQQPMAVDEHAAVMEVLSRKAGGTLKDQDIARATKLSSILAELKSLDASVSAVSDDGIRQLSHFTALQQLNLTSLRIDGAGLEGLEPLANLRELSLASVHMGSTAGWERLGKLPQVEILNLALTNITDAEVPFIVKMTGLRDLNISNTKLTDAALLQLATLENLEILRIANTQQIKGTGFKAFAQSKRKPGLRCVYAANTQFSREGMSNLKRIPNLELFDNTLAQLSDQVLFELKGATNLRTLAVGANSLTAASGPTFQSMRNLENLDLSQSSLLTPQILNSLSKMTELKTLNLSKTACTPANIQDFQRLRKNCEVIYVQ